MNIQDHKLKKPNELISIKPQEDLSALQRKVYNVFLKKAQQQIRFNSDYEEIDETKRYFFEIPCKEVQQKAGLGEKNYKRIRAELEKLMSIVITVVNKENKHNWSMFHLVEKIEKQENVFIFYLDGFITQALKKCDFFTSLDLIHISRLKNKYAVIFYELAIRYIDYKIPKMSIEELREITNTKNKYNNTADLKRYVLDRAFQEINEKTNISIEYTTEKKGRKITHIDFNVSEKKKQISTKQSQYPQKNKQYSKTVLELYQMLPEKEQIERHKKILANLIKEHSFDYLKADIEYTKEFNPDNFFGFLKTSCKEGHYAAANLEKEKKEKQIALEKAKKQEKEKQLKAKIEKKSKEKAIEKYENSTEKELEEYKKEYDELPEFVKNRDMMNLKTYILGKLQEEYKKELNELSESIF